MSLASSDSGDLLLLLFRVQLVDIGLLCCHSESHGRSREVLLVNQIHQIGLVDYFVFTLFLQFICDHHEHRAHIFSEVSFTTDFDIR